MPNSDHNTGLLVLPAGAQDSSCTGGTTAVTISPINLSDHAATQHILPLYVLSHGTQPTMVVELIRFSQPFGSWIVVPEDAKLVPELCSNGNMTFVTRVDSLFCALALMEAQKNVGEKEVFQPLDSLCLTPSGADLSRLCPHEQFSQLCDVKEAAGQVFYRFSDEKAMQWLLKKHAALGRHPSVSPDGAVDIISQYLPSRWKKAFSKSVRADSLNNSVEDNPTQTGADLAMAVMMEDAKKTSQTIRRRERGQARAPLGFKKAPARPAKKQAQSASAANWWASRQTAAPPAKRVKAAKTSVGTKRTRSTFSTK